MAEMSRAIRHVIEDHSTGRTLQTLSDDDLGELTVIVGAFYADMRDEFNRRSASTTDDRSAVVSEKDAR